MNANLSLARLVLDASLLVQLIMLLLAAASVVSWAVIISKRGLIKRLRKDADDFENRFWSGGSLVELYDRVRKEGEPKGLIAVFAAGFEEYLRQQEGGRVHAEDAVAAVQRQMRVAHAREIERMEAGLSMLATIGSVSPYIGLFGTVWGIMHSFVAIGAAKQASLAMVAPGIAEALVATAIGLFAAIPAVIGFNFSSRALDSFDVRIQTFSDEMIGIIERGLRSSKA